MITLFLCILLSYLPGAIKSEPACSGISVLQKIEESRKAKIKMEVKGDKVIITGIYQAPSINSGNYYYKLTSRKEGKSGTSNNSQSGRFKLKEDQTEVVLSTTGYNLSSSDKLEIELQVFRNDQLISSDILHYVAP